MRYRLTSVDTVNDEGSWLFTVRNSDGDDQEVILVPCENGDGSPVEAWVNRCTHEAQRLHREEIGVVTRQGEIICPKHGSAFDTCSGDCDNGPARDSTLWSVEIAVENGDVYLTDDEVRYLHDGSANDEDDEDGPSSTSHLRF